MRVSDFGTLQENPSRLIGNPLPSAQCAEGHFLFFGIRYKVNKSEEVFYGTESKSQRGYAGAGVSYRFGARGRGGDTY